MEHYGCFVDLLCRCGNFQEALMFTLSMPYEPDSCVLGSLVASCGRQNEIELVEHFFKHLLEPESSGNYVGLSNAYAAAGKWNEVSEVRETMTDRGLKKNPGCNWVQIDRDLHAFVAGDRAHEDMIEIDANLALLDREMQQPVEGIEEVCFDE